MSSDTPLRIGMLGCATTAALSMFKAIAEGAPIAVTAIAARDPERAKAYAVTWDIPQVFETYEALLAHAEVDAIYVPLANSLHHRWVKAALAFGHHVLCEKPIALNAAQATEMVAMAEERGLVLVEAFHWRAHPMAQRIEAIIRENFIGEIEHIDCWFESALGNIVPNDIRMSPELGGGILFDMGGYCVNFIRMIAGDDVSVISAEARPLERVDGAVTAQLLLSGGGTAELHVEMDRPGNELSAGAYIRGSRGNLIIENPFLPNIFDMPGLESRITLQSPDRSIVDEPVGFSSYFYQAKAFAARVRALDARPSPARDGIANMRVLDAIRAAAGLPDAAALLQTP